MDDLVVNKVGTCTFVCRWFKECEVQIPSEKVLRKRAGVVVGDCVEVEKVALTFPLSHGEEEVKLKPYGYIPDLWMKVVQLLEENERQA
jgi:hypothetical protein